MQSDLLITTAHARLRLAFPHPGRVILGTLVLLGLISRWLALPASLWEWDDILFARSLHRYSVPDHSPHPPGFPVFVLLARIIHGITLDEHIALTTLAFLFSLFLLPILFLFFQEIFSSWPVALSATLLCGFSPTVWAHACAGRSDGPALVTGLAAATLFLRGRRSLPALWAGCITLGIGAGIRVTVAAAAAPILAYVLLGYLRRGEWKILVKALCLTAFCALAWYVPLIWHEGWARYQSAVKMHGDFIWRVDSAFAEEPNGRLSYRAYMYFWPIWGAPWIAATIYVLAAVGTVGLILRRQWLALGWLAGGFLPFMIFVFLVTTPFGAPYYSLPYIPFFTGLAAYGLFAPWRKPAIGFTLACLLTLAIGSWTQPIIKLLHEKPSPTFQAVDYLKKNLNPASDMLVYDGVISPHVNLFLPNIRRVQSQGMLPLSGNLIAPVPLFKNIFYLTENPPERLDNVQLQHFFWPYEKGAQRLFPISLQRYFHTYVSRQTNLSEPIFGRGWWEKENGGDQSWRWMGPQSETLLPPISSEMMLRLAGIHSLLLSPTSPATLTLRLNGQPIERLLLTEAVFDRQVKIKTDPNVYWSVLQIEVDKVAVPSQLNPGSTDHRTLSLRCTRLEWTPAPGSAPLSFNFANDIFGSGWYDVEKDENGAWRWMGGEAITNLPALPVKGLVELRMSLPTQPDNVFPLLNVEANQKPLPSVKTQEGDFTRTIPIPFDIHQGRPVTLKFSIKPVPGDSDQRDFGLRVSYLGWRPQPDDHQNTSPHAEASAKLP